MTYFIKIWLGSFNFLSLYSLRIIKNSVFYEEVSIMVSYSCCVFRSILSRTKCVMSSCIRISCTTIDVCSWVKFHRWCCHVCVKGPVLLRLVSPGGPLSEWKRPDTIHQRSHSGRTDGNVFSWNGVGTTRVKENEIEQGNTTSVRLYYV